jgi:Protein of unknown function (DUF1329)
MSWLGRRAAAAAIAIALVMAAKARAQTPPTSAPTALPAHPSASSPPSAGQPGAQPASAALTAGVIISSANQDQFARFLPEAAVFALKHGFTMKVMPSRRLTWSAGFEHATEKYSPQVGLDSKDHLKNYVAGLPFPLVNPADPKAAVKIAYNWHMGPFMPDDFSLAPWSSNGYGAAPANPALVVAKSDADFACDQFTFLRFAHRTEVDPRPTLGENPMGVEWKARCNAWTAIGIAEAPNEGAGIWVRYLDPSQPDEFYGFSKLSRRVRRSAVNLAYPGETCRSCHQPFWAYALPKTEIYTYRLLGTTTILGCLAAAEEPAGIAPAENGYKLTEEPFEPRHVYILEMIPIDPAHASNTTIVYIDSEIYVWLAARFYQGGKLSAVAMPLWRMRPASGGGNLFDLAGSFYVPLGQPTFFRSLVPAHGAFQQKINTGAPSEAAFMPQNLER